MFHNYPSVAKFTKGGLGIYTATGHLLLSTLYDETPLGSPSIQNPKERTRNMFCGVSVIDPYNSTPVQPSLAADYKNFETKDMTTHLSQQIQKATKAFVDSQLINKRALEKTKNLTFTRCEAGHIVPEKTSKILEQQHNVAVTVVARKPLNGQSNADKKEFHVFLPKVGGDTYTVSSLLTRNTQLMKNQALTNLLGEAKDSAYKDNFLGVALVDQLSIDAYHAGKLMYAKNHTQKVMAPYSSFPVELTLRGS